MFKYLFFLVTVILVFWSVVITYITHINYPMEYDEGIYLSIAHNIHEKGFPIRPIGDKGTFFVTHPHLSLFVLAFWESLFEKDLVLIRLLNMLTWFFPFMVILFLFAKKLANTWGGILALFWASSSSFMLHNAILTKLDVPLMVMFALFFFLFYLF